MTIIDKLKASIEALEVEQGSNTHMPFVYAPAEVQNIVLDGMQPPFVVCMPIESAAVEDTGGTIRERITIAVWFADLMCENVAGDYDALENEQIIDRCKRRAFRWAASLSPAKDLRLVSLNGSMRAYLERDAFLTGYMLNATIEEMDGVSRCNI